MFTLGTKTRRQLLLVLAIVTTLAYAWLFSHLLEPTTALPGDFVSEVVWRTVDGSEISLSQAAHENRPGASRLITRTQSLGRSLNELRPLPSPIRIAINERDSTRLFVASQNIEIGVDLLRDDFLLSRALVKAWLLQTVSGTLIDGYSGFLAMEVLSDSFTHLLTGYWRADVAADEKPGANSSVNWLRFASSNNHLCESKWMSEELRPLCSAKALRRALPESGGAQVIAEPISLLSMRPLLSLLLTRNALSANVDERWHYLREWVQFLRSTKFQTDAPSTLASLESQRDWLRNFARGLALSTDENGEHALTALFRQSRLLENQTPLLDVEIFLPDLKVGDHAALEKLYRAKQRQRTGISLQAKKLVGLLGDQGPRVIYPETIATNRDDSLQTELGIWSSCKIPRAAEIVERFAHATRVAYLRACEQKQNASEDLRGDLRGDLPAAVAIDFALSELADFAKRNANLNFVILQVRPLRLAIRLGRINAATPVTDLAKTRSDDLFGAKSAHLDPGTGLRKALGAIEALQWFRLDVASAVHLPRDAAEKKPSLQN